MKRKNVHEPHLSKNHFKEAHVSGMDFCSSWMIFVHMHQGTTRDSNYTSTKCKKRLLNRMWVNGMMPFLSESQKHIKNAIHTMQ